MRHLTIKYGFIALLLVSCATKGFTQMNSATPKAGQQLTEDFIQQNLIYPDADLQSGNKGKERWMSHYCAIT